MGVFMKPIIYLIIVFFMIQGCSYKNTPVELLGYKGVYKGDVVSNKQKVYLRSVKDARNDLTHLGHKLKAGKRAAAFMTEANFAKSYEEALKQVFKVAGFKSVSEGSSDIWTLDVTLKKLEIEYSDKSIETNLLGRLELEVVVVRGEKVTKLTFKPEATQWLFSLHDSKALEPFLYKLFEQSVHEIVYKLTQI